MNPQVPNDLISAYFDGEASPEERAAVENLLEESVATRRELDEIAQLSALLHSFPRESAPAELVANVQRATDQKPLAVAAPIHLPRSLRREWTAAALASILTAAALMLMVNLTDRSGARGRAVSEWRDASLASADRLSGHEQLAMKTRRLSEVDEQRRLMLRKREGQSNAEPLAVMEATDSAVARGAVSPSSGPKSSGGTDELRDADAKLAADPLFDAQQFRNGFGTNGLMTDNNSVIPTNDDFLNGLKVGQVFTFVPQVADPASNVAVVDLEVLDIEQGADQVQVLLSRHDIKPRLAGQAGQSKSKNTFGRTNAENSNGGNPNELVVVYSRGPGEKLAKTLEEISQHPDLFLSWSSQPPVQLSGGEGLATADGVQSNDKSPPAAPLKSGKQVIAAAKDSSTEDNMDGEAEQALTALLARNNYSNVSTNFDSQTNNFSKEQSGTAKLADSRSNFGGASKAQPAPAKPDAVSERKSDPVAKKSLEQRSGQTTLRVTNEAPVVNEPALPLVRSQGQNYGNLNTNRRYIANLNFPAAAMNSNNLGDANQPVKVLFVLHPAQPVSAPAPAEKPNR